MNKLRAAIIAALFLFAGTIGPGEAQDVSLTSRDGGVKIEGTLLGFDGTFYRVQTIYGELTLDGTGVTCKGPGCPDLENFVAEFIISGARTMGETLMPALVQGFAAEQGYSVKRLVQDDTHFKFELRTGEGVLVARIGFRVTSSDEGFADLLADEADMALSLREVRRDEVKRGREAGLGNLGAAGRSRVIALDGLTPITAPENPVKEMSLQTLAEVFGGKIRNWSALGGPDQPITLHMRSAESGLWQAFEDQVLDVAEEQLAGEAVRYGSNADLADAVARDPFALGITSFSEVGNAERVALKGSCGFRVPQTRLTLKAEDYPLTAPMFLYTPARRLPQLARDFLRYMRAPRAQIVIRRMGFVDQAPVEMEIARQGERFANAIASAGDEVSLAELQAMVARLSGLRRLTTTFRFRGGSADLDPQSRSNAEQLARALEAGIYDDREIVFVGFSDGMGAAGLNKRLARTRARAVRDAVLRAAPTADQARLKMSVDAFGEALPMACDDTVWGRQVNRRVEVWVR